MNQHIGKFVECARLYHTVIISRHMVVSTASSQPEGPASESFLFGIAGIPASSHSPKVNFWV